MCYNALVKFRDEQLENYQGHLEYSASDYHHVSRPAVTTATKRILNSRVHSQSRRRSQFSIVTDGSRYSISGKEPKSSRTVESYDPYRSSRTPIANPEVGYANVTIHRASDDESHVPESSEAAQAARHTSVNKVRSEDSCQATSPPEILRFKKPGSSTARSYQSRSSLASSRRGFSPAPVAVRSASYKRNVSFQHIRKRSHGAASVKCRGIQAQPHSSAERCHSDNRSSRPHVGEMLTPDRHSSPALPTPPAVVRAGGFRTQLNLKRERESDMTWKEEARKISSELSQICEEAFNRSSISTGCTVETSLYKSSGSPPTSISTLEDSERIAIGATNIDRPLPGTPTESLGSSTIRDLTETRRKLIEHSNKEGSERLPGYLTEVISHLDRLIEKDKARRARRAEQIDPYRRAISDPMPNSGVGTGYLPAISEDPRPPNDGFGLKYVDQRINSEPTRRTTTKTKSHEGKPTVRLVPHESVAPIEEVKPLNIRKKNRPPPLVNGVGSKSTEDATGSTSNNSERGPGRHVCTSFRHPRYYFDLEPIEENPKSPKRAETRTSVESKKWSWFNKHKSQAYEERAPAPPEDVQQIRASNATVIVHEVSPGQMPPPPTDSGTKNVNQEQSFEKSKGGFLHFFSKKKADKPSNENLTGTKSYDCFASSPTNFCAAIASEAAENESEVTSPQASETSAQNAPPPRKLRKHGRSGGQNWFARFFHIKPATRVVALKTTRVKARKDVYRTLRDWKQYGIEEVHLDKGNSVIYVRVGEVNCK